MLKVFLSSTFRDLGAERAKLLEGLDKALEYVGMENFIPDGSTSQEIAINKLKDSDIIIFLISSWYGSLLEKCDISNCAENCLIDDIGKISYTHCEYKISIKENKPHQSYIINKRWDLIRKLSVSEEIKWEDAWDDPLFKGISHREIEHYREISKKALEFRSEVKKEYSPCINEDIDIKKITSNLACKILEWHSQARISFKGICGRKEQLKDLIDKIAEGVEVFGAGGVGKTTLIHLALLILKLKGKKIIAIARKQSYSLGSGYKYFIDKCKGDQYEISGNTITLNNIIDILALPENVKLMEKMEKISKIAFHIKHENTILFIDDFHLAEEDVKSLIKFIGSNIIIASKKKIGIMRNELLLSGILFSDRDELINTICARLNKTISFSARERIKTIAEGHPVSTELLVRNSDRINFDKLNTYKQGLDLSNSDHTEEFIKRLIEDVLNEKSYALLKSLSVINTSIASNLDAEAIRKTYPDNFHEVMAELIDTGMIKKRENSENIYQFTYRHIEEVLTNNDIECHEWALIYYKSKISASIEDRIEEMYHQSLIKVNKDVVENFIKLINDMAPNDKGFSRLIDLGILINSKSFQLKQKATILEKLGYLYGSLNKIDYALKYTEEAKAIYEKMLRRNKNNVNYKAELAYIYCNLGNSYHSFNKHLDAEKAYNKSLSIYGQIPTGKQKKPHYMTSIIHMNKGNLYTDMNRFEDALNEYKKSLEIISLFNQEDIRITIDTLHILILLYRLYINMGMIEISVCYLKDIINQYKDILPCRLIAICYKLVGLASEKDGNPKEAARNYMYAAANFFKWFQMGGNALYNTNELIEKIIILGDEEARGEAIFIKAAIGRMAGRDIEIPKDIFISRRIKPLKETLDGNRINSSNFSPNNEIELMIKDLSNDIIFR